MQKQLLENLKLLMVILFILTKNKIRLHGIDAPEKKLKLRTLKKKNGLCGKQAYYSIKKNNK